MTGLAEPSGPVTVCEVCGHNGAQEAMVVCSNKTTGCPGGRHVWCYKEVQGLQKVKNAFRCSYCKSNNCLTGFRVPQPISQPSLPASTRFNGNANGLHKQSSLDSRQVARDEDLLQQPEGGYASKPALATGLSGPMRAMEIDDSAPPLNPSATTQNAARDITAAAEPLKPTGKGPLYHANGQATASGRPVASGVTEDGKRKERPGGDSLRPTLKKHASGQLVGRGREALKAGRGAPKPRSSGVDSVLGDLQLAADGKKQQRAEEETKSESKQEQKLRVGGKRKGQREAEDAMRLLRHGQVVAESLLQPSVWQGRLKLHCSTPEGEESVISVSLTAYGVAGNGHSLDASLKLPRPEMSATLLPLEDTLEMTLGEANDNATLVFSLTKGQSSKDFMRVLSQLRQPPGFLAQVLLGQERPFWLALLQGPDDTVLGAFVRFAPRWAHSDKQPGKGLLKNGGSERRQKIRWPDNSRSVARAPTCERGQGAVYTPGHYFGTPDDFRIDPAPAARVPSRPSEHIPPPRPLSHLHISMLGYSRRHEKIMRLRQDLARLGAHPYSGPQPWPGCTNIMLIPMELVEKGLEAGYEELEWTPLPLKDFLRHSNIRIFANIDYAYHCCRLQRQPTDAELQQLKVREVLPDGIIVVAEAAAIHAAAQMRLADRSVLEQILDTLEELSVRVGRRIHPKNSAWHFKFTPRDDEQLRRMNSPALQSYKAHRNVLTFLNEHEIEREHNDLPPVVSNAVGVAQYFRWYCRHVIVMVRREDKSVMQAAERCLSIHTAAIEDVLPLMRQLYPPDAVIKFEAGVTHTQGGDANNQGGTIQTQGGDAKTQRAEAHAQGDDGNAQGGDGDAQN